MLISRLSLRTRREDPADATSQSHRLLVRAGFLEQVASGVFAYLPLMWRVIRKVDQIVREEMDRAGAIELNLPILQPRALWDETKRWGTYRRSGILFHLTDRKGEDMCLSPTAEEVITDLARRHIRSYRDLPFNWYQIGPKFRDELRPRYGLVRAREFIMKDAYSFDSDESGMRASYMAMRDAYAAVCERCGLRWRMVEADSGPIGGSGSAEFMILAQTGEDAILECGACDYGANTEKAEITWESFGTEDERELEDHETPNIRTVEQLSEFFQGISAAKMVKTILYQADQEVVAVLMRGDLEINETKLRNFLQADELAIADDRTVVSVTGAEVGFAGPVGLNGARIVADNSVKGMRNFLCGKNQTDHHLLNVNHGRDFPVPAFVDLRKAKAGDKCPKCQNGKLKECRGIEMGHIFMLQTKYSKAMQLTYLDEKGKEELVWMGCYGIGVSRIAAAAAEQSHDGDGIIWPESLAPYRVIIVPVSWQDDVQRNLALNLYGELREKGVEVLLDDRDFKPGVKFKDADLIGIPWRVNIGRQAHQGLVELRERKSGAVTVVTCAEVIAKFS